MNNWKTAVFVLLAAVVVGLTVIWMVQRGEDKGSAGGEQAVKVVETPQFSTREEALAYVRNGQVDLQDKCRAVHAWAVEGGEEGVNRVIAAAKEEPALREIAVRALGRTQSREAGEYIVASLGDKDMVVLCAAIAALAEQKGEAAVPDIAKMLKDNRSPGYQVEVAVACVKALGSTMSSEALPALEEELSWVLGREETPEYGMELMEAVADIGDSRGAGMLEQYADELEGKLSESPEVRRDQMLQITEARKTAEGLR